MTKTAGASPSQQERQDGTDGRQDSLRDRPNLTLRYGKIGIASVAAAARYCDAGRNPAYAPVVPRNDHRLTEIAA